MQTTLQNTSENRGILPRHVILIGSSARAAAQSALAAGMLVSAIDQFGDQDLRSVAQRWTQWTPGQPLVEPLRDMLLKAPQELTAVALVGGAEAFADSLESARQQLESPQVQFLIPTAQQLRLVTDPSLLQAVAARSGFEFPAWTSAIERLPTDSTRWLIKPFVRCGGLSVRECPGEAEFDPRSEHYFQRFVAGELLGASYCADDRGVHCLGVCLGRSGGSRDAPFRYTGSIGPIPTCTAFESRLHRLGREIYKSIGLRGVFGVDLICTATEVYLLEINARYCASMELLDTQGMQCMSRHIESFFPRKAAPPRTANALASKQTALAIRCKRILYARRAIVWDAPRQELMKRFIDTRVVIADVPPLGTNIAAGAPLVTLLADGDTAKAAWRHVIGQSIKLRARLEC